VPFDNKTGAGSHAGYPFGFESTAADIDALYVKLMGIVKDPLHL
jgi:hypothetical protein